MKFSKRKRHLMKINEERNRKGFAETLSMCTREGLVIRMKKLYTKLKKILKNTFLNSQRATKKVLSVFKEFPKLLKITIIAFICLSRNFILFE